VSADRGADVGAPATARLLDKTFVVVTLAGFAYFLALGIIQPVLPNYVESELGGGGVAIGSAVGAFALTAALGRPLAGRIGDRWGRRVLSVGGAAVAGTSILLYGADRHLFTLIGLRLVTGIGEAAAFVGLATAIQDLAPDDRRGEAASYFSVAVFGGLGVGAPLGEAVYHNDGPVPVWVLAAAACAVTCILAFWVPPQPASAQPRPAGRRRILQRDAIRPGIVLALAMTGYAAFATFVPVYVHDIGMADAGGVLALYAFVILAVRIFGGRLPDRLGAVRVAMTSLTVLATGLVCMAVFASPAGLYVATLVFTLGQSLVYPSLLPLAIGPAPPVERTHAMATFTLFFDVSQGVGAVVLGAVVALSGERAAFLVAAAVVASGVLLLRRRGLSAPVAA
jgi:MFS family permease